METGGGQTPVNHLIEWLAEWGREVRRRQRGLLLSSAHRAKGLEFDHVAVLDGGWRRVGEDEDADAPRRLYYVAMTRARKTLMLARAEGGNHFLKGLTDHRSFFFRQPVNFPPARTELRYQYVWPGLSNIDLGFAGRFAASNPVHEAIAQLSSGDPLQTRITTNGRWILLDQHGRTVGRLAARFEPPIGTCCLSAKVSAVVEWSRDASGEKYRDSSKCDAWEVIVPELSFAPLPDSVQ